MHKNKNSSKDSITAILIGFFLIALTTVLFFAKATFFNKKNDVSSEIKTINEQKVQDLEKYSSITVKDLSKKINSKEKLTIIDIRDTQSFKSEHIIDSKNVPSADIESNLSTLNKEYNYIIVDNLGLTLNETQALDIFLKNNFENVAYLEGGLSAWKNGLNPTISIGNSNSLSDQSKVTYIKSDDFKNILIEESELLYSIDLRKNSDYIAGHIINAKNIPFGELEKRRGEIPYGKKIILYDNDGVDAFLGAVQLYDMGFFNVLTLSDGLNIWKQKGFEVIK